MFLIRGIEFSYETVRDWETKLTPSLIDSLRRRRKGRIGKSWYVDETYIKVNGHWCYLYRAIDRFGALVDVRLSEKRDTEAAKAFFRSAKAVTGVAPARVTTDGPYFCTYVQLAPPSPFVPPHSLSRSLLDHFETYCPGCVRESRNTQEL